MNYHLHSPAGIAAAIAQPMFTLTVETGRRGTCDPDHIGDQMLRSEWERRAYWQPANSGFKNVSPKETAKRRARKKAAKSQRQRQRRIRKK